MPRPLFSTVTLPASYSRGTFIGNKYAVVTARSLNQGRLVVAARDIDNGDSTLILVTRTNAVDPAKLAREIQFLKNPTESNGRRFFVHINDDFQYDNNFFAVFDPSGVTLRRFLTSTSALLTSEQVREMTAQILKGLDYLHNLDLVHTDLHPGNIFLMQPDITIQSHYDYELNAFVERSVLTSTAVKISFVGDRRDEAGLLGTDRYRSPEIITGLSVDYKTDLFSLGCTMVEMATRKSLFCQIMEPFHRARDTMIMMRYGIGPFPKSLVEAIEHVHRRILAYTCDVEPVETAMTDEAMCQVTTRLLSLDARDRPEILSVLRNFPFFCSTM